MSEIYLSRTLSVSDLVEITLALRSQISSCADSFRVFSELGKDTSFFVENIKLLVHAYNSVSGVSFFTDDPLVTSLINH